MSCKPFPCVGQACMPANSTRTSFRSATQYVVGAHPWDLVVLQRQVILHDVSGIDERLHHQLLEQVQSLLGPDDTSQQRCVCPTRSCQDCRPGVLRFSGGLLDLWMPPAHRACFTCRMQHRWLCIGTFHTCCNQSRELQVRPTHPCCCPIRLGCDSVPAAAAEETLR